jgi:hypothetical protein
MVARLLVLVLVGVVAPLSVRAQDDSEKVKKLIEAIKARGEPVSNEDLRKNFPLRPGVEDVTSIWLAGMKPLAQDSYRHASRKLPIVGEDLKLALPDAGPIRDECEAFLEANQLSLRKFYEATSKGGFARFPVDRSTTWTVLTSGTHPPRLG